MALRRRELPGDARPVEALLADHHETTRARLVRSPGAVEVMLEPRADALHQQAHRLAGDFDKALYAQDIMRERAFREPRDKRRGVRRGRDLDDETVEIVVIVIFQPIVMRRAIGEIVLGGGGEA